jgi:hypothetical protein
MCNCLQKNPVLIAFSRTATFLFGPWLSFELARLASIFFCEAISPPLVLEFLCAIGHEGALMYRLHPIVQQPRFHKDDCAEETQIFLSS